MLTRLLAWLRRDAYVKGAIAAACASAYQAGYEVGRAHGEVIGREGLASDIIEQYGRHELTEADAVTIRSSQRH